MKKIVVTAICVLFVVNAWYNFHKLFLEPVTHEYRVVSQYIRTNYRPEIKTVNFIRSREDFFIRKYGITRSRDEFGVPSTFFGWVPSYLIKQIVFEETGDRKLADSIVVNHWEHSLSPEAPAKIDTVSNGSTMLVDAEAIIAKE